MPVSIFDGVKPTATRHKKSEFDGIPEVDIEKFMKDILPGCSSIEAYFTSDHKGNLVTMTTAENKESKRIFRWPNNFSWTYNGNLAGKSQIKQAVKAAGGFVDAFFRFSIMWNDEWQKKKVLTDLDAHCVEPGGNHIYYSSEFRKDRGNRKSRCGGQLDIDMICPEQTGVENIYYTDKNKLMDGDYKFYVHHYSGTPTTFKAEIVFADQVYTYNYTQPSRGNMDIKVIRYDESNQNIEALKGQYGQYGDKKGSFTVVKNLLFVNLYSGAVYNNEKLPSVYDGFLTCSDGTIIEVKNSILNAKLDKGVTAFGVLVLQKWN